MPELPEVETLAADLRAALVGRTVVAVDVRWEGCLTPPDPAAFSRSLEGQTVEAVSRRGKWVVLSLSAGQTLLIHPRMTGQLLLDDQASADERHVRAVFTLDDGRRLVFADMRKFGRVSLLDDPQIVLSQLGPEPLSSDFTAARLKSLLSTRRGRIKPLLLNQRFLAGLGNIYTDEALWRARINPFRRADTLADDEMRSLHRAIRSVLRAAIARGGTTLSDETYKRVDGQSGAFAPRLAAYGRAGEPCTRCRTSIEKVKLGGRGTHFCPVCQPPGPEQF